MHFRHTINHLKHSSILVILGVVLCSALAEASPCVPTDCKDPDKSGYSLVYACDANALLYAIDNGEVKSIQSYKDCQSSSCACSIENGFIINIKHSGGVVSYCHVGYVVPNVVEHAVIKRGQMIGAIGSGGNFELALENSSYTYDDISLASSCSCVPNCVGKNCGSDGCGGNCGSCTNNSICTDGVCSCIASASDTESVCGDNGCGSEFKYCEAGKSCQLDGSAYQCLDVELNDKKKCLPQCRANDGTVVRACGDDGCGGTCGSCSNGMICQAYQCICEDSCDGRQCGMNACGEPCGTCPEGTSCDEKTGICECIDDDMNIIAMDCTGVRCGQLDLACDVICPCSGSSKYDTDYLNNKCTDDSCGNYDEMGGRCGRCSGDRSCHVKLGCLKTQGCKPNCNEVMCGDDGCGGTCGICGPGYHCEGGICYSGGNGQDVKLMPGGCNLMAFSDQKTSIPAAIFGLLMLAGLCRRRKRGCM